MGSDKYQLAGAHDWHLGRGSCVSSRPQETGVRPDVQQLWNIIHRIPTATCKHQGRPSAMLEVDLFWHNLKI